MMLVPQEYTPDDVYRELRLPEETVRKRILAARRRLLKHVGIIGPEGRVELEVLGELLRLAMNELPEPQRIAMTLVAEGCTPKQIAQERKLPVETVRQSLEDARRLLLREVGIDEAQEGIDADVVAERLRQAMNQLPEPQRRVMTLVAQGRTHNEIANELGLPVGTVQKRLHDATEQLLSRLRQDGHNHGSGGTQR